MPGRAGAFHYVAKPFKIEQLLAAIESAVTSHRQWQELAVEGAAARAGTASAPA